MYLRSILCLSLLGCGPKPGSTDAAAGTKDDTQPLATVHPLNQVTSLQCEPTLCEVSTMTGSVQFSPVTGPAEEIPAPPRPVLDPWPVNPQAPNLNTLWNESVANRWRSPFRPEIPAPDGGILRTNRGVTPGTSRVVRLGGSVVTARIGLDPGPTAYPNTLALHPTGQEAYLIVWPNPDLIAFNARTLQTTWRVQLGAPALGLFLSADGRYLVAELDGEASEHQLLDYEPAARVAPDGVDPNADASLTWLARPTAKQTALVDLTIGKVVALLPGKAVGFSLIDKGAVIASEAGIAAVAWPEN